jgi:hypothetical protein
MAIALSGNNPENRVKVEALKLAAFGERHGKTIEELLLR